LESTGAPASLVERPSPKNAIMAKIRERFVFDKNGRPAGVHIDFVDCQDLMKDLEAEQCVRAYDEAGSSGGQALPFEHVVAEIERRDR
jgi:hypothetical protein